MNIVPDWLLCCSLSLTFLLLSCSRISQFLYLLPCLCDNNILNQQMMWMSGFLVHQLNTPNFHCGWQATVQNWMMEKMTKREKKRAAEGSRRGPPWKHHCFLTLQLLDYKLLQLFPHSTAWRQWQIVICWCWRKSTVPGSNGGDSNRSHCYSSLSQHANDDSEFANDGCDKDGQEIELDKGKKEGSGKREFGQIHRCQDDNSENQMTQWMLMKMKAKRNK